VLGERIERESYDLLEILIRAICAGNRKELLARLMLEIPRLPASPTLGSKGCQRGGRLRASVRHTTHPPMLPVAVWRLDQL
jgi:hypothetical protein